MKLDVATFTSPSTVHNFVDFAGEQVAREALDAAVVACIGPITARAARGHGLRVDVEAAEHTIPGLIDALVNYQREKSR